MKTVLFLLFILLNIALIKAQDFFAPIGATWYFNDQEQEMFDAQGYVQYTVDKDTIVNDFEVRKISVTSVKYTGEIKSKEHLFLHVRDSQVYHLVDTTLRQIYDFTAKEGDTLKIYRSYPFFCDSVTPITLDSIRYLHLGSDSLMVQYSSYLIRYHSPEFYEYNYIVTERIGTTTSFLRSPYESYESRWTDGTIRCYSDSEINFKANYWIERYGYFSCDTLINGEVSVLNPSGTFAFSVMPNPVNSVLEINFGENKPDEYQIEIRSVLGAVCYSAVNKTIVNVNHLPSGLYLIQVVSEGKVIGLRKFLKE